MESYYSKCLGYNLKVLGMLKSTKKSSHMEKDTNIHILTQMMELSDKDFKIVIFKVHWNMQLQTFLQLMLK